MAVLGFPVDDILGELLQVCINGEQRVIGEGEYFASNFPVKVGEQVYHLAEGEIREVGIIFRRALQPLSKNSQTWELEKAE